MGRLFYICELRQGAQMDQWVLMKAYLRPSEASRGLKKTSLTKMTVEVRDGDQDKILGSYEAEEWLRMAKPLSAGTGCLTISGVTRSELQIQHRRNGVCPNCAVWSNRSGLA